MVQNNPATEDVWRTMEQINQAWIEGRPGEMGQFLHPDIVMVFPGFAAVSEGAEAMIAGFEDFTTSAEVESFSIDQKHVHVIENGAVVSFTCEMVYQRQNLKYRATCRDLWMFTYLEGTWKAVWRTMLDLTETSV